MESTAAARLPAILADYHARFPKVAVHLHTDTAGGLMDRLARGDIDAAFIGEPVPEATFDQRPVFVERLVLIGPANGPTTHRNDERTGRTTTPSEQDSAHVERTLAVEEKKE